MNMPLAACLPDFGSGDMPKAIEDHTPAKQAGIQAFPGAGDAKPAQKKVKDGTLKSAGSTLKSVVRHIKLVDQPEISPLVEPTPPVDIDALIKESADKVRAEEAEKARVALAAALATEREAHEEQRRKERAEWIAGESSRLAERIVDTFADLEDGLSDSMVRIFTPFLKAAVRDKALGELQDTILSLLGEAETAQIEVSGPADLIEKISGTIAETAPERAPQIIFTVSESADVRVVAGNTVCATQLGIWNQRIEAALGLQ